MFARSGSISPNSRRNGPGRENQPSNMISVRPSDTSRVVVPANRTVTAPSETARAGASSQSASTGGAG